MSLGKRLLKGSVLSMVDLATKIVAVFVVTPVMVHSFGQEGYGAWLLAMSIVGYLLVLDLGVTFSATQLIAVAVGAGKQSRLAALLEVIRRYFVVAGLLTLLLVCVFLPLMPWMVGPAHAGETIWVLALCGGVIVLKYLGRSAMIRLRAHVRYDLLAFASVMRTICQTPIMCWVLLHSGGLLGAAVVHASGEAFELLLQQWFAGKLSTTVACEVTAEERALARRDVFAHSRDVTLGSIGWALRRDVNPFLVSRLAGVGQVAVYSLGVRLISILEDVVNAIFGGQVLAALGQLHGAGHQEALLCRFRQLSHLTAIFSAGAMGGVLWLSEAFLRRWVGEELSSAASLTWILAFPYAVAFMMYPANNMLFVLGKTRWVAALVFAGGCLSLLLSIALGFAFGLHGVVAGSAIAVLIERGIMVPWLLHRCVPIRPLGYVLRDLLSPAVRGVIPAALFAWGMQRWVTPDYTRLMLLGTGYVAVFALTCPWLALEKDTRQLLWSMMPFIGRRVTTR